MSDQYRETTYKGWGTRLKESLGGIVVGLIVLVAMPWMLFWNEGRAVQTARSLAEGAGLVREVPAKRAISENTGKLVHVADTLKVAKPLEDPVTGISVLAVHLKRTAEMYQWVETCQSQSERKLGGGEETVTTCNYTREWRAGRVSSEGFKQPSGHTNPEPTLNSGKTSQESAALGAFTAGVEVLNRLPGGTPVQITPEMMTTVRTRLSNGADATAKEHIIYLANSAAPAVGDMRLVMTSAPVGQVSVVGKQLQTQGKTQLVSYQTEAGDRLLLVSRGIVSAADMFKEAELANKIMTWFLRVFGLLFLFIGLSFMLRPLAVLADVVPIAGTVVRYGIGTVAAILALLIGGVTIGIAWIWYRPLVGLAIMAVAVIGAFFFWRRGASNAAQVPMPAG